MKKLILSALAIAAMVGCSKTGTQGETPTGTPQPITFGSSINIATKVADDAAAFLADEQIKVVGYKGVTAPTTDFSTPFIANSTYKYVTNKFESTETVKAIWELGATHHFYAYYPSTLTAGSCVYTAGTTTDAPKIDVTVPASTGIADDLMGAHTVDVEYNGSVKTSNLVFNHKLSKIRFVIKLSDATAPAAKLTALEFKMSNNAASYNVVTETLGALTLGDVTLAKTGLDVDATEAGVAVAGTEWLVLPGDTFKDIKATINGAVVAVTGLTAPVTEQGKITTITLTVKGSAITFTASIVPWGAAINNGAGDIE